MRLNRRACLGLGAAALARPAQATLQPLETVAQVPVAPGGLTVTAGGRIVVSAHPAFGDPVTAIVIDPGGVQRRLVLEEAGEPVAALAVRAAEDETVWMIAAARGAARWVLHRLDAVTGAQLEAVEIAASALTPNSAPGDIAVDRRRGLLYIADPAAGPDAAVIVVSPKDGAARRLLRGHPSVQAQHHPLKLDGRVVGSIDPSGAVIPLLGGVDAITIDADHRWVYYGAFSGTEVYRVSAAGLADPFFDNSAVSALVERVGAKKPSAGITVDDVGNVYLGDPAARGLGVIGPKAPYRLLAQDNLRLDWPCRLAAGPGGYVYACSNGLYRRQPSHAGPPSGPPYFVTRVQALGPTSVGR